MSPKYQPVITGWAGYWGGEELGVDNIMPILGGLEPWLGLPELNNMEEG